MADSAKIVDRLWSETEELLRAFRERGVELLYLSQRRETPESSIIARADTIEKFRNAVSELLASEVDLKNITILTLHKICLFEVPENIGKEASRFLITIRVIPEEAERIYQSLSMFRPSSDIAFTYLAFVNAPTSDTLTLSVFAKSDQHLQRFVLQELRPIRGIISITTSAIARTRRLIPYAEMVEILRREVGNIKTMRPLLDLSDLSQ